MTEWQLRQEVSHRVFPPDDFLKPGESTINECQDEWLQVCLDYFTIEQPVLIYPCKAFCVAYIYAQLLHQHFNRPVVESLSDKCLLYGNDQYFRPYGEIPRVYDFLIENVQPPFNQGLTQVKKTIEFFNREFLIGAEYADWLPGAEPLS